MEESLIYGQELLFLSTVDILFSKAVFKSKEHIFLFFSLHWSLLTNIDGCTWNIKTGLYVTQLQQCGDYLAYLVPSCATGFEMSSICCLSFLEKFLKEVTNYITWTFPLLWFTKLKVLLCRPNSNSDISTDTSQIISLSCTSHSILSNTVSHCSIHVSYLMLYFSGKMTKCNFSKILRHRVL